MFRTGGAVLAVAMLIAPALARYVDAQVVPSPQNVAPAVIHAHRAADPVVIDGKLTESVWAEGEGATGFRQIEPMSGEPAQFRTEVRIAYDADNLYVAFVARDPLGRAGMRVQDLRRKFDYYQNDLVGLSLDPLGDGHNAYAFQVTPLGNLRDLHVLDGQFYNRQWQAVWRARTTLGDEAWIAELAIPWTSLRYIANTTRMRVNFHRIARRENELSGWVPWPRSLNPYRMDYAGWIEDLETPPPGAAVWARPYTAASTQRSSAATTASGDLGGELLWQPTPNTVVEGTVNTDFAQADVDRQVVNLRRFSVFFPEQRQFFLDTANLFDIGTAEDLVIRPFFSRRVGLSDSGAAIPLAGGVRAVRSSAAGAQGVMVMQQESSADSAGATFVVGRASRNFGGGKRLGGLFTGRRDAVTGDARSSATGAIDGFVRVSPTVTLEGMASGTSGVSERRGIAGYTKIERRTSQLTTSFLEAMVTRGYTPTSGFVSRTNVAMHAPYVAYDWRPRWRPKRLRNINLVGYSYLYTSLADGALEESYSEAWIDLVGRTGGLIYPDVQHFFQRLNEPFQPVPGVVIPPGHYSYVRPNIFYGSDRSRRVWYSARVFTGPFYDRRLDQVELRGFLSPSPRIALGISANIDHFRGKDEPVTTRLVAPELRLAWNPRIQVTTFYQYNDAARQGTLNARFSWEFRPLSYLYVVLNDARGVGGLSALTPGRQQLLVKFVYFGHL